MLSLTAARQLITTMALPGEPISVALTEALGLVLAESAVADVDLPPFDRSTVDGLAFRVADAHAGVALRLVSSKGYRSGDGIEVGPGRAARVKAGDPLPVGADTVVAEPPSKSRSFNFPANLDLPPGRHIVRRGNWLTAGTSILNAGTRLTPAMVGLLASQGYTHPVCHRRVRVAVAAVGDDLVGPGDAPVLNRERNAANLAVTAPLLQWGALPLDLGAVGRDGLEGIVHRAFSAQVALILGPVGGLVSKTLERVGMTPVFEGVALEPGGAMTYGVVRDGLGKVTTHVVHISTEPLAALASVLLVVAPLIAKLQGGERPVPRLAIWDGTHACTSSLARAIPVRLIHTADARCLARPLMPCDSANLPGFAQAEALVVLEPESGPWTGGELVEAVALGR